VGPERLGLTERSCCLGLLALGSLSVCVGYSGREATASGPSTRPPRTARTTPQRAVPYSHSFRRPCVGKSEPNRIAPAFHRSCGRRPFSRCCRSGVLADRGGCPAPSPPPPPPLVFFPPPGVANKAQAPLFFSGSPSAHLRSISRTSRSVPPPLSPPLAHPPPAQAPGAQPPHVPSTPSHLSTIQCSTIHARPSLLKHRELSLLGLFRGCSPSPVPHRRLRGRTLGGPESERSP